MSENFRSLHNEFQKGQAQFAYFLLGVAVSAIAFFVHMTSERSLEETPWQYAAAVTLWGLSFLAGCSGIERRQDGLAVNANFVRSAEQIPSAYRSAPGWKEAITDAENDVKKQMRKPLLRFAIQRWSIFLGAAFFLAGHVQDMASRSPVSASSAQPD